MGTCKYCGKSVGLFSNVHKECEEKHDKACAELSVIFDEYFRGLKTASDVNIAVQSKKNNCFASNDDIARLGGDAMTKYCQLIRRPFPASILGIAKDFIAATGVSYSSLNANGAIDNIAIKLMKGFIADFFTDILPLDKVMGRCDRIKATFPISNSLENEIYMDMLEKASANFMKDGTLTATEQQHIDDFAAKTGISLSNLPVKYQDSDIAKVGQAAVLRDLQNGVYPICNVQLPIVLSKNEHVLWAYNGVSMYMEKIERETVGRSGGFSFRVCKGVTYRVGQFKGHPVEHSRMNLEGNGILIVTNKNLIFYSQLKNNKVPFNKIVGITPYSDGIEVHKDGNAKRLTFQGFDSWFIMNLLSMVGNI